MRELGLFPPPGPLLLLPLPLPDLLPPDLPEPDLLPPDLLPPALPALLRLPPLLVPADWLRLPTPLPLCLLLDFLPLLAIVFFSNSFVIPLDHRALTG